MQPYFIPYAGYFRLFAASDLFVIYDCVQFPRRGWVHRNRLLDAAGRERWLTLPLAKAPRDVRIRDLRFSATRRRDPRGSDAADSAAGPTATARAGDRRVAAGSQRNTGRLPRAPAARHRHLPRARDGRSCARARSEVPDSIRGQDRIIEIARRLGALRYVNAPGGRTLYEPRRFEAAGIELQFLDDYRGPWSSILQRVLEEDRQSLSDEIFASSRTSP